MKSISNLSEKVRQIHKDIHQMTKIGELIEYIPIHLIEKLALLQLIIWTLSPIIIIFSNNSIQDVGQPLPITLKHIFWYQILQTVGFLGCILNIFIFSKSIMKAKSENLSVRQYFKVNPFLIFLFIMLIWSIFSCIASDNIDISLNGTLFRKEGIITYFTYCGILGCGYVIRSKKFTKYILEAFTISAAFLSILMLVNSKILNKLLGLTNHSAVFLQFNHFGYYLCMSTMCVLLLFQIEKKSTLRLVFRIVLFSIIVAALVENGSLGPYIAVAVGLSCSVILTIWLNKRFLKRTLLLVGVFIIVTITMNIYNGHLYKDIWTLGGDVSKVMRESPDVDNAGTGRWILWRNGVRFIYEKPIFGYGPDNLGEQYAKVNIGTDRAHNEIIQFAASLGIPAAVFYIIAMINYFIGFLRNRKKVSTIEIGMFCTVVAYLASSMFGNTMYYTSPFFFMLLGLSGGMQKILEMKQDILH